MFGVIISDLFQTLELKFQFWECREFSLADEELIEGANFSFTRFAAPVLCEAGERVNTRWGASPALGLDFAGLRRAAASLDH